MNCPGLGFFIIARWSRLAFHVEKCATRIQHTLVAKFMQFLRRHHGRLRMSDESKNEGGRAQSHQFPALPIRIQGGKKRIDSPLMLSVKALDVGG